MSRLPSPPQHAHFSNADATIVIESFQKTLPNISKAPLSCVVTAARDHVKSVVQRWTPRLVSSCRGHRGVVTDVAFGHKDLLGSCSSDGSIAIWHLDGRRPPYVITTVVEASNQTRSVSRPSPSSTTPAPINCIAISPNGSVIVTGSRDGRLRFWQPSVRNLCQIFKNHSSSIRRVSFSSDGSLLVSASADKSLKLWSATSKTYLSTLSGHTSWANCAAFVDTSNASEGDLMNARQTNIHVVSGSDDRTSRLWDINHHRCVHVYRQSHAVTAMSSGNGAAVVSSVGNVIAMGLVNGVIDLYDTRDRKLCQHYEGHVIQVSSLQLHPSGNFLLSTADDCVMKIWDLREGRLFYTVREGDLLDATADHLQTGPARKPTAFSHSVGVCVSRCGERIATATGDLALLWSLPS